MPLSVSRGFIASDLPPWLLDSLRKSCCLLPNSFGVWCVVSAAWFLGLGLWALAHAFVAWTGFLEYPDTCSLCAQFVVATVAVMPRGFYCNTVVLCVAQVVVATVAVMPRGFYCNSIAQVPPKHSQWIVY